MKIDDINFENGIKREWVITNGIGGYASSTMLGINTRKYHGLLVAPLSPPAQRHLILSKVDETIEIEGKEYNIYSNMCKNSTSKGYEYLQSFEKEFIPIFIYKVEDVTIKKYICMEHGKNTVVILYKISNSDKHTKLVLTPILNFRDFHQESCNHEFHIRQEENQGKLKVVIDGQSANPVYLNVSNAKYIKHENDSFKNMYYIEEEKRGFVSEENHAIPGRYEIEILPNEQKDITFITSLEENIEEIDGMHVINSEIARISGLIYDSNLENEYEDKKLVRDFIIAADNFVVYRPSFGLHTIIAGYPWFLDWGRDALISFEGLLLKTKRYEVAKDVILTMIRDVKYGLVPNGYSGYDNRPLYNSADSALLLFEQVQKYIDYTDDYSFIKEAVYPMLKKIISGYCAGIDFDDNDIYLDKDGLITSGTEKTQNTWMDAKVGDLVVTPRNGKTVEINAMWYNALKIMQNLCTEFKDIIEAKQYRELAEECKISFIQKFYNKRRKCLYDVLGDSKIRPNQLFALSLSYPIIDPTSQVAKEIMNTVNKKLLNNYGLKTLAKGEENYVETYEGDSFKRDTSYHQGITWPWLLGLYFNALKRMINDEKSKVKKQELEEELNSFKKNVEETFIKEFREGRTIGGISEIYDSVKPFNANGAINQAWSVSEVFRIIFDI